ncbi:MAG: FAD-dependent oxidoreductase [Acidobacteriota bacterium]
MSLRTPRRSSSAQATGRGAPRGSRHPADLRAGGEPFAAFAPIDPPPPGRRVAVVGGGIAGLAAAWRLADRHRVDIFEAAPTFGGHTVTVEVDRPPVGRQAVDMGFIVFNRRTYPRFCRLLDELGIDSEASCMSFAVRDEASGIEWNGESFGRLLARRRNAASPRFWQLVTGILRFHREAVELLGSDPSLTLGELLAQRRWSRSFVDLYLEPMMSALWSTEPGRVHDFPVRTLVAFLHNHGMLTIDDRPTWRVVRGGSSRYVEALLARLPARQHAGASVERIHRPAGGGAELRVDGAWRAFDHVILAVHADRALALLDDPSIAEREVLGALPFQRNVALLHTDRSAMPRRRRAWASWNVLRDPARPPGPPRVTYWMNRLQNLDGPRPNIAATQCFVTLNREEEIDPSTVHHRRVFHHPLFTADSTAAKARWREISGRGTHYCGAYWGFGFHEDGMASGERVARDLGATVPLGDVGIEPEQGETDRGAAA